MSPKIAVVDDDASVREALRLLLTSAGFDAAGFASAEDFLESGEAPAVRCIVTDLRMPGRSGFHLVEALRDRGITQPVIVVSAFGDAANRRQARQLGVKAFFQKPVDDQALLDAIVWVIEDG